MVEYFFPLLKFSCAPREHLLIALRVSFNQKSNLAFVISILSDLNEMERWLFLKQKALGGEKMVRT